MRMGGSPTGPRRADLRGPPRSRGRGAVGVPSGGGAGCPAGGPAVQDRIGDPRDGGGPPTARGNREPWAADRRGGGGRSYRRGPRRRRHAAVPGGGPHRGRRAPAAHLPLPGPPPSRDDPGAAAPPRHQPDHPRPHGGPGLRGGRDAVADQEHSRGGPRLPGPGPAAARQLLRASPVPPAAQAAADGGRSGPLLPDGPVPPRRGPPGRSELRVHPARHGDVVRERGGRLPCHRAAVREDRGSHQECRGPGAVSSPHLRRDDGPLRDGPPRPSLRHGAGRSGGGLRRHRVPGHRRGSCRAGSWTSSCS